MANDVTLNLLVILFLVLSNGLFVAAEFAIVRVRRTRIDKLIEDGVTSATVVRQSLESIDRFISATQVGITLASLALGAFGEPFIATRLTALFSQIIPAEYAVFWAHGIAGAVALFTITFCHVVVGEMMPKSLALQYPERVALYLARPMQFFLTLFRPLIWILNGASTVLLKGIGVKVADTHSIAFSEEELLMLLSESKKAGVVTEAEQKMLQNVFKFHDKTVREIMKPRPDMDALELRADENEIREAFEKGFSRLPVYDETLDNVKGVVYVKDLLYTLQDPKLIKLIDLLREPAFVPESMPVSKLLQDFQKGKIHMAIVVDEFGDTAGLVTLEDVIEEIVGEIQDEYDYEPAEVQRAHDGVLIFDGKTAISRFKEVYPDFEMPEGSFETIAGLVFQLAGRVPKEGDVIPHGGLSFKITKREGRRLRKITVLSGSARPSVRSTTETPSKRSAVQEAATPERAAAVLERNDGEEIPQSSGESARLSAVEKSL